MPGSTFLGRLPRWRVVFALIRRDFGVSRSYRFALVFDFVFALVELATFYFISRTFGDSTTADLRGAPSYFAFAVAGVAVTAVVAAASAGLADRIREEQLTGTLESLVAQPVTPGEIALGLAGFPFLFAVIRASFYLAAGVVLLGLGVANADWIGFFVVLLVTGATLASLGIVTAAAVIVVKKGRSLVGFVIFGMGFVSGALFPIAVLPGWLQPLGKVMPTRFAFDGLRSALYQGQNWLGDALVLVAFSLVGLPLALAVFSWSLRYAQRSGSLTQY